MSHATGYSSSGEDVRGLLSGLVESGQLGPAVKAVFDRGLENKVEALLSESLSQKDTEIREICHANYAEFLSCLGNLTAVKGSISELKVEVTSLNNAVQESGADVLTKAESLHHARVLRTNINATLDVLTGVSYVMTLCSKAQTQINAKKYFSALKSLNQLERVQLPKYAGYTFVHPLREHIHGLVLLVRNDAQSQFNQWALGVVDVTLSLGEAAMTQAEVGLLSAEETTRYKEQQPQTATVNLSETKNNIGGGSNSSSSTRLTRNRTTQILFRPKEQVRGLEKVLKLKAREIDAKQRHNLHGGGHPSASSSSTSGGVGGISSSSSSSPHESSEFDLTSSHTKSLQPHRLPAPSLDVQDSEEQFETISSSLNLAPIYQCLHIYQSLGVADEFRLNFREKRRVQCLRAVDINKVHLDMKAHTHKDPATKQRDMLLERILIYLSQIAGFFIVEDAVVKGGASLRSRLEVEELWELAQAKIEAVLKSQARKCKDVATLLQLKYAVTVFHKALDSYELRVSSILDAIFNLRPRLEELLSVSLKSEAKAILLKNKYEPVYARNYAEFSENAFRYGLVDESVNVTFPTSLPFSCLVPEFCASVCSLIHNYQAFANYIPLFTAEHIWQFVEYALTVHLNGVFEKLSQERLSLSQVAQIAIDATYLASACEHFEKVLFAYMPDSSGGLLKLAKPVQQFQQTRMRFNDLFFENLSQKLESMLALITEYEWTPSKPLQQCHGYIDDLCIFLQITFASMPFVPDNIREGAHFTSCNQISQALLRQLHGPNVKKFTQLGIVNLELDVARLEEFADLCPIQDLKQTFRELRNTCDMFQSPNFDALVDAKVRTTLYPTLHDEKLLKLFAKYKGASLFDKIPNGLKKITRKQVDKVATAIRRGS